MMSYIRRLAEVSTDETASLVAVCCPCCEEYLVGKLCLVEVFSQSLCLLSYCIVSKESILPLQVPFTVFITVFMGLYT